jgi:DNA modification methylase
MKQPEYKGNGWVLHNSDCVEGMASMPENSVDLAIFSPPFGDLFVYSDSERDLGNAGTGEKFINQYMFFAKALTRVMKPGRIVCVHCTDLPMRKGRDGAIGLQDFSGDLIKAHTEAGLIYHGRTTIWKDPVVEMQRTKALGLLYKQIRKDSAMNRVGMPDYMLFFRKDGDNHDRIEHVAPGDIDAAMPIAKKWLEHMRREGLVANVPDDNVLRALLPHVEFDVYEWQKLASPVWMNIQQGNVLNGWRSAKQEDDERHVCPLQLDTIQNCLRLYSKPGDVVMDPFNGIGSTGYEAVKSMRRYVGFELKKEYAEQAGANLAAAETHSMDLFA